MNQAISRLQNEIGTEGQCATIISKKYRGLIIKDIMSWIAKRKNLEIYYLVICAKEIRDEHIMRLAMIAFIAQRRNMRAMRQEFRLFNVLTNERLILAPISIGDLRAICDIVLDDKVREVRDDDAFIEYARKLI